MPKLWVKYGKSKKNGWFRPHLFIGNTGYADNHWQEMHFRDGTTVGAHGVFPRTSLKQALDMYMSEIERMGYQIEWREQ